MLDKSTVQAGLAALMQTGDGLAFADDLPWDTEWHGKVADAIEAVLAQDQLPSYVEGFSLLLRRGAAGTGPFEDRIVQASKHWRKRARSLEAVPLEERHARRVFPDRLRDFTSLVHSQLERQADQRQRPYDVRSIDVSMEFNSALRMTRCVRTFDLIAKETTDIFSSTVTHNVEARDLEIRVVGGRLAAVTPQTHGHFSIAIALGRAVTPGDPLTLKITTDMKHGDRARHLTFTSTRPADKLTISGQFPEIDGLLVRRVVRPEEYRESEFDRLGTRVMPDSAGRVQVPFESMQPEWFYGLAWDLM